MSRTYWVNPDPHLRHGTLHAYYKKGCRCDRCYGAWADRHEQRKATDPTYIERRRAAAFRYNERKRAQKGRLP